MEIFPYYFLANGKNTLPSVDLLTAFYEKKTFDNGVLVRKDFYEELSDENEYKKLIASLIFDFNFESKTLVSTIEWLTNDKNTPIHFIVRKQILSDDEVKWVQHKQTIIKQ